MNFLMLVAQVCAFILFKDLADEGGLALKAPVTRVEEEWVGRGQNDEEWFNRLYQGELQSQDFVDLGMSGKGS